MASIEQSYDAVVDAGGTAVIAFSPTTNLRPWTVSQVSVELPGASGFVTCTLRKNGTLITPLVAAADAAGGDPPVQLAAGDVMTVTWTGAAPGVTARAYVIYTDGAR